MKTLLITGGFGYLGGRLALAARRERPDVRVMLAARPQAQVPPWASDFPLVRMTLGDREVRPEAMDGVDTLVHLAALNEHASLLRPLEAFRVNTLGTHHLLDAAVEAGVKRVVYLSTFHVYDRPPDGRITERTPTRPSHPYASSHRAAEDVVEYFRVHRALPGLVLRLSNAFGPPAHPGVDRWTLLLNDLCRQAATKSRLTLNSSGMQRRDFIPMSDAVSAVLFLAARPELWGDGLFNLGSGRSMTVLEAARMVARVHAETTGGPLLEIDRRTPLHGETDVPLVYDTGKLLRTGFAPEGEMASEIQRCLEFCSEHFAGEAPCPEGL